MTKHPSPDKGKKLRKQTSSGFLDRLRRKNTKSTLPLTLEEVDPPPDEYVDMSATASSPALLSPEYEEASFLVRDEPPKSLDASAGRQRPAPQEYFAPTAAEEFPSQLKPLTIQHNEPLSTLIQGSFPWTVQMLGTIPDVEDWRTPSTRMELLEMIDKAQAQKVLLVRPYKSQRLHISPLWLNVTDEKNETLFARCELKLIGSVGYVQDDSEHVLVVKCCRAPLIDCRCLVFRIDTENNTRHICKTIKNAFELHVGQVHSEQQALSKAKAVSKSAAVQAGKSPSARPAHIQIRQATEKTRAGGEQRGVAALRLSAAESETDDAESTTILDQPLLPLQKYRHKSKGNLQDDKRKVSRRDGQHLPPGQEDANSSPGSSHAAVASPPTGNSLGARANPMTGLPVTGGEASRTMLSPAGASTADVQQKLGELPSPPKLHPPMGQRLSIPASDLKDPNYASISNESVTSGRSMSVGDLHSLKYEEVGHLSPQDMKSVDPYATYAKSSKSLTHIYAQVNKNRAKTAPRRKVSFDPYAKIDDLKMSVSWSSAVPADTKQPTPPQTPQTPRPALAAIEKKTLPSGLESPALSGGKREESPLTAQPVSALTAHSVGSEDSVSAKNNGSTAPVALAANVPTPPQPSSTATELTAVDGSHQVNPDDVPSHPSAPPDVAGITTSISIVVSSSPPAPALAITNVSGEQVSSTQPPPAPPAPNAISTEESSQGSASSLPAPPPPPPPASVVPPAPPPPPASGVPPAPPPPPASGVPPAPPPPPANGVPPAPPPPPASGVPPAPPPPPASGVPPAPPPPPASGVPPAPPPPPASGVPPAPPPPPASGVPPAPPPPPASGVPPAPPPPPASGVPPAPPPPPASGVPPAPPPPPASGVPPAPPPPPASGVPPAPPPPPASGVPPAPPPPPASGVPPAPPPPPASGVPPAPPPPPASGVPPAPPPPPASGVPPAPPPPPASGVPPAPPPPPASGVPPAPPPPPASGVPPAPPPPPASGVPPAPPPPPASGVPPAPPPPPGSGTAPVPPTDTTSPGPISNIPVPPPPPTVGGDGEFIFPGSAAPPPAKKEPEKPKTKFIDEEYSEYEEEEVSDEDDPNIKKVIMEESAMYIEQVEANLGKVEFNQFRQLMDRYVDKRADANINAVCRSLKVLLRGQHAWLRKGALRMIRKDDRDLYMEKMDVPALERMLVKRKRRLIRIRKKEVPFDHPEPKHASRGMSQRGQASKDGKSAGQFQGIPKSARGVKADDSSSKDWKDRVVEAKKAKRAQEEEKKAKERQQKEEKWDAIPVWKRKLMEQKEAEAEKEAAPKKQAELKKKELMEKVSAMAPWRRELFIKKHGLEAEFGM